MAHTTQRPIKMFEHFAKTVNGFSSELFWQDAPPYIFDRVLKTPLP